MTIRGDSKLRGYSQSLLSFLTKKSKLQIVELNVELLKVNDIMISIFGLEREAGGR